MEYRTLGRSGCAVSTPGPGHDDVRQRDRRGRARTRSSTASSRPGGTLVDTADVYSGGVSRGDHRALAGRPARRRRDQVVLATKGRFPMGDGPNDARPVPPAPAPARSTPRCAGSASSTSTSTRCTPATRCTPIEETLRVPRRRRPRRQDPLRRAVELHRLAAAEGRRRRRRPRPVAPPVTLQPQYNLLVREIEWEIVPACRGRPASGLLPWSPLGGGWLTGKYPRDERARPARPGSARTPSAGVEAYDRRSAVGAHLGRRRRGPARSPTTRGVPMAQVALAWLRRPARRSPR